ncbi:MAG: L-serine ammonia-lyase [Rhizobiales bacterium]|nr:L-serine ammonia-lyase [Hyphomicrobiales bacterium]
MVSVFDIFKIGIGPSSSHTVGPMVAAGRFLRRLERAGQLEAVARVRCEFYGSLAFTGKGHGTDKAVLLGLMGETPAGVAVERIDEMIRDVQTNKTIMLAGRRSIPLDPATDIVLDFVTPSPGHPNAMRLIAYDGTGAELANRVYFSVGGGFVTTEDNYEEGEPAGGELAHRPERFAFRNARELLDTCAREKTTIAEIVLANERALRPAEEVDEGIDRLWKAMMTCIDRGLSLEGILPGGLSVRRRAKGLYEKAIAGEEKNLKYPHQFFDRVSAYAIAVNEENAAGGRVVTSPTNGAAGVIPAVLRYYRDCCPGADHGGVHVFLLTATAFGAIIKYNASLSGAEVGCQGEVGSASAMGAAGLCAALGGTPEQIENAAEIALEHHLGMTCDPVGGLVQVPCIERNAMGAIKAINAASLALAGDGRHIVFFDTVVETMRQTGLDMQTKYKETSQGGLAVNVAVVEC